VIIEYDLFQTEILYKLYSSMMYMYVVYPRPQFFSKNHLLIQQSQ